MQIESKSTFSPLQIESKSTFSPSILHLNFGNQDQVQFDCPRNVCEKIPFVKVLMKVYPNETTFRFMVDEKLSVTKEHALQIVFHFLLNTWKEQDFSKVITDEWLESVIFMHYFEIPEESEEMDCLLDTIAFADVCGRAFFLTGMQRLVQSPFWKKTFEHLIIDSKPFLRCIKCSKKKTDCKCNNY